jgi:hypothetical protein
MDMVAVAPLAGLTPAFLASLAAVIEAKGLAKIEAALFLLAPR